MKLKAGPAFYLITIGTTVIIAAVILNAGKHLALPHAAENMQHLQMQDQRSSLSYPLATFILQVALIIFMARLLGWLFKKIGQPAVMGEIIAGVILGPSVAGFFFPGFSQFLFPPSSLGNLQMFSQIGLILFMFVVGMELDLDLIKKNAGTALVISHAGIVIPLSLGITLAYFLYSRYAPAGVPFFAFSLFIGVAMSMTAFPVLSRIIRERGLSQTKLGNLAITCAAVEDVSAWCLLAVVLAIVKADRPGSGLMVLVYVLIYGLIMFVIIKPFLKKWLLDPADHPTGGISGLTIIFVLLLLSAYATEVMGIHALFGAFLAGIIMPANETLRKMIVQKIEDVALILLLPLFFAVTGLRTYIGLLNERDIWLVFLLILVVAVTGKFGATAVAARISGESLKDSLSLGALMNTRGLVEVVVLNIGYDLHILTPVVFTLMVLMALITTCMTNPILNLINRIWAKKKKSIPAV